MAMTARSHRLMMFLALGDLLLIFCSAVLSKRRLPEVGEYWLLLWCTTHASDLSVTGSSAYNANLLY